MKAYMGYSREAGSQEGAILIFAHNAKEARQIGFPFMTDLFDSDWIDAAVRWLKDSPHIFAEANQVKIEADEPHVIDSPKSCNRCELWGKPMDERGICEDCREVEEEENELGLADVIAKGGHNG